MASSSQTPPHPQAYLESPLFEERAESGLYDAIADQIASMHSDALANIDYPDHFTRVIESWSKNYKYMGKDGDELRTSIIGEIVGPSLGTVLRAHGNYYARDGDNFKPVDDKVKIKDTIAICAPTCATTKMFNTFLNQLNTLGQVTDSDADEDVRKGNDPVVRLWTRPSKEGSENHDIIVTHMLPKYAVPSAAGAPKPKRTAKRKLDEIDEDVAPPTPVESKSDFPAAADIKIGAHYEPSLLPDYGGTYFNHIKSKLVQLDVRDVQNNLIPPWKFYEALRPGTLVLIDASLHCFLMPDEYSKEKRDRKIYQINAHSIRVLSESDAFVEERLRPIAPNSANRVTSKLSSRSTGFSNFVVPNAVTTPASPSGSGGSNQNGDSGDVTQDEEEVPNKNAKGKGKRSKRDH